MEIKIKKQPLDNLRKKYPCIVAWCRVMGSYDYYVNNQLSLAEETKAPWNAIYADKKDGEIIWHTADGIQNVSLQWIKEIEQPK